MTKCIFCGHDTQRTDPRVVVCISVECIEKAGSAIGYWCNKGNVE